MSNLILDFFFPITVIEPVPEVSASFLKQVCVVANKNGGGTDATITQCSSNAEALAITDNTDIAKLFAAGMSSVYVLTNPSLDLDDILAGQGTNFYTLLISSDFDSTDMATADFGDFPGVVGVADTDADTFLPAQAAISKRCSFFTKSANKSENLFYAFGKLLSNLSDWRNQQYIELPDDDEVNTLGDANALYNDGISFCLTDAGQGKRLALFAAGKKTIVAPYILRNFQLDCQNKALTYISANQPPRNLIECALIQDELNKVRDDYIKKGWITSARILVTLDSDDNFALDASIAVPTPQGTWRIFGELTET